MAYTPTEWETGDVITAEKLNKAEEGIAAASPYIVSAASYDPETYDAILDSSFGDIYEAVSSGRFVIFYDEASEKNVSVQVLDSLAYDNTGITQFPYVVVFRASGTEAKYHAVLETDPLVQYNDET